MSWEVILPLLLLSCLLQVQELAQLQQQLYEELSRTPEEGAAFTDVVKTVLERETAFVKWKSEGASPYWDATGSGPDNTASCESSYIIALID